MYSFLKAYETDTVGDATHLSLVGGKYTVSGKNVHEFHKQYVNNYKSCFLVEKVKYPSFFYIDVDKIDKKTTSTLIQRLKSLGLNCIIAFRKPNENNEYGMHVIASNVVEDKYEAIKLCTYFVGNYGDISVYNTGLRMIGSNKNNKTKRVYFPYFELNNGTLIQIKESINTSLLNKCSIHFYNTNREPLKEFIPPTLYQ